MKTQLALSALALAISTTASAATVNFNNGSGTYSASGITATVTATGGSLYYASLQPSGGAIGVKSSFLDVTGGLSFGETMTVTFNQAVHLNAVSLTNWIGGISGATISYTGGSTKLSNSDLISPIDTFSLGGLTLTSFTLTASNLTDALFLHDLDATAAVPVPGAAWLMGSGLAGLVGFARRKKAS